MERCRNIKIRWLIMHIFTKNSRSDIMCEANELISAECWEKP